MRSNCRPRPLRPRRAGVARLLAALALVATGLAGLGPRAGTAGAAVQPVSGYRATVLGWSSWYGSYALGAHGTAWCIDHGIRAPDPALRYVPTTLTGVPAATQAAMAWAFGRYGTTPDRVTSAALMLVGHDLMGATYPYGRMDVTALTERSIAGFGGDGPAVLARARAIRADAVARSGLRGPWQLTVSAPPAAAGARATATVRLTAGGAGVGGISVAIAASGASLAGPATVTTGPDGTARATVTVTGPYQLSATARVPDLALQAFAPTAARAQRVVRAATLDLRAVVRGAPATTTSTTAPATTTSTTTTTTTAPTTTTSTSTTSTSTTTSTTAPATTTSTTAPRPSVPPPVPPASVPPPVPAPPPTTTSTSPPPVGAPPPPALPRTGGDVVPLASTGVGLVLLGTSIPRPRRRGR